MGIYGAAAVIAVSYAVMAVLNLIDIRNQTGLNIDINKVILKPLAAAAAMSAVIFFLYETLSNQAISEPIVIISSMVTGFFAYLTLLIINGGIDKKDLSILKSL